MIIKTIKKVVQEDGSVKIYEYRYESDKKYYLKAYQNKKKLHPKVECPICHRMIFPHYMKAHQAKKVCSSNRVNAEAEVKTEPEIAPAQ